jgi:hypothetical protein
MLWRPRADPKPKEKFQEEEKKKKNKTPKQIQIVFSFFNEVASSLFFLAD